MKALIDGDSLVYTIGFACQQNVWQAQQADDTPIVEHTDKGIILKWIEDNGHDYPGVKVGKRVNVSPPEHAYHTIKVVIQKICQAARTNSYIVYLTGKGNFREGLATIMGYKHNRMNKDKPALYEHIRWYLQTHQGAKMIEGMEADDALSMVFTRAERGEPVNVSKDPNTPVMKYPEKCVICAIDKDLRTVAGTQINFDNKVAEADGRYKTVVVTEVDALRNFYKQMLTGDTSDNIIGVPRIGPKKADAILEGLTTELEMFDAVYAAYKAHYGTDWFEYYRYDAYVDTTVGYSKRELKPEAEILPEQRLQGHALTMLLENARLLHMLRTPIAEDGSHWWMPPRSFDELMAEPEQAEASGEPSSDLPWLEIDGCTIMMSDLEKPGKPFTKGRAKWFVYIKETDTVFGAFASQAKAKAAMESEETLVGHKPQEKAVPQSGTEVSESAEVQTELPLDTQTGTVPECVTSDDLVTEPADSATKVAHSIQQAQGGDEGESSAPPLDELPGPGPVNLGEMSREIDEETDPPWWTSPWWETNLNAD